MIDKFNVPQILIDFSQKEPDKKAVIYNGQSITYSEFRNMTISLSDELKQMGVGKNDYVAIYMSNSIEMILSIFAILNCNAVVVPISIDLPIEQISSIVIESKPRIILYNAYAVKVGLENNYNNITTLCVDYNKLDQYNKSSNNLVVYEPNDLAYCIFTSGSSGIPKGVLLTYKGILNHIEAKISLLQLTSESHHCLSFNIGFVASVWQIITPILLGAQLFIYDNSLIKKPYQFLEQIERDEVNVVSMIPQSLYGYCNYLVGKHQKLKLLNLKNIILTGEKVDKVVVESFYKIYDHISLINAYGQSECSDDSFHYVIPHNISFDDIPIGKPIQNITYLILNDDLTEAAHGEKGELYISGTCLSQCYLNNEQLTKEKFVTVSSSTFYRTGDIVKHNENQDVIYLGRADNQIKIRGYRVEPEEIETHLNKIESIEQSIVIALETNEVDKILGAFYTSDINISSNYIVDYLSSKLPSHMLPSVFKRVEKFVINANGKIDRNRMLECKEIKCDDLTQKNSNSNSLTDIQKSIYKVIISNLSEIISDNVSLDMNFNSIGLDSITFIKTVVELEHEFDFEFEDDMLLITKFSTVKSMIEYVESKIM